MKKRIKKKIKDNIGFFMAIAVVAVIVGLMWMGIASLKLPDKNEAEKTFNRDRKSLETVMNYLENSNYNYMYIVKTTSVEKIEDEAAVKAIKQLFKRGYDEIGIIGNTIYFLRWTRWKDFGAGLAYSINKEYKPELDYLDNLESLSEDGWYYYEVN